MSSSFLMWEIWLWVAVWSFLCQILEHWQGYGLLQRPCGSQVGFIIFNLFSVWDVSKSGPEHGMEQRIASWLRSSTKCSFHGVLPGSLPLISTHPSLALRGEVACAVVGTDYTEEPACFMLGLLHSFHPQQVMSFKHLLVSRTKPFSCRAQYNGKQNVHVTW